MSFRTTEQRPILIEADGIRLVEAKSIEHLRDDFAGYLAARDPDQPSPEIFWTVGNIAAAGFKVAPHDRFFGNDEFMRTEVKQYFRAFTLEIGGVAYAFMTFDPDAKAIVEVYTFGSPFHPDNPNFIIVHEALYCLADELDADHIPIDPVTHHLDHKMLRNGTKDDTSTDRAYMTLHGTIVVPLDVSDKDFEALLETKYVTLDISALPQARLDQIRNTGGSLYTTQSQVVLRQLRETAFIIAPQATCLAAPALVEIRGSVVAPVATFVYMPLLARVRKSMLFPSLEHADFQNLGAVCENIDMPALKFGAFPNLCFAHGKINSPKALPFYAPYLKDADFTLSLDEAVQRLSAQAHPHLSVTQGPNPNWTALAG